MGDRFAGKSCVLCPRPSVGVGEHVWPAWLLREFNGDGPFKTEKSGKPYLRRDKVTVATSTTVSGVHVPMCETCNNDLNTLVEVPAKPVIRKVLPRSLAHAWPHLTAPEAAALGRWFIKVGLLLSHPEAVPDNPHEAADGARRRPQVFDEAWSAWMRQQVDPPPEFSVYVSRRNPQDDRPHPDRPGGPDVPGGATAHARAEQAAVDTVHVMLPGRITVAGTPQHYMTRTVGFRGLDATIVWHPGWPIKHPLVEARRAAVLWPNPSPVDLAALPHVREREFSFVADAGRITCTETAWAAITSLPLQVGLVPSMAAFHVGTVAALGTISDG